ncbi:hypothetical protein JCM10908_001805 [Rhodotorula pacifica]|uniref:ferroxidase n=1 Tax=Rhodotorula pacifica TaxID=1495444 RepID=UPI003175EE34
MQRSIANPIKRTLAQATAPRAAPTLRRFISSSPAAAVGAIASASSSFQSTRLQGVRARGGAYEPCRCFSKSRPTRQVAETDGSEAASHQYSISHFTTREYHDIADRTMDRLTEYLEEVVESLESDSASSYDVEYSTSMCGKSGVLTIRLGDYGTYVLNKQPPNKQIWLSSPKSGPKRYDWDEQHRVWFYNRDGDLLHDLLNRELREALGDESIEVDLAEKEED